jgi:hypothetical protein
MNSDLLIPAPIIIEYESVVLDSLEQRVDSRRDV